MKWQNKLSKKELKHLQESGITTLSDAKRNAEYQLKQRQISTELSREPCWECKKINRKLGLPI